MRKGAWPCLRATVSNYCIIAPGILWLPSTPTIAAFCYPVPEWEQIERQIESLSSFDPMSQRVKHLLIGHANDLELDSSGRILLPQELRQYAQLEKHVCLIGQGKKLEIWSQEIWNQQRDQWLSESTTDGELPDKLRSLSL